MYKKTLISVALIFLVSSCAEKANFTQGVSQKDKKIISSYDDKILFIYGDIRITKNGFYPNFKILARGKDINREFMKSKYTTKVASYLGTKRFNLKIFMDDVNRYGLKEIRAKLLALFEKFPNFKLKNKQELEMILAEKNLKIVDSYIERKTSCSASYRAKWYGGLKGDCDWTYYRSKSDSSSQDKSPSYSGSNSSSGCRVQTVYVPGGNGRTAQTTICN